MVSTRIVRNYTHIVPPQWDSKCELNKENSNRHDATACAKLIWMACWPVLPPGALMISTSDLLLWDMPWSVAVHKPGSLLKSLFSVTNEGHMNAWSLLSHLIPMLVSESLYLRPWWWLGPTTAKVYIDVCSSYSYRWPRK